MTAAPSARVTWLIFLAAAIAFVVVYLPSFDVKPAGDDFGYISEVHRGRHDGVWALFRHSVTGQTYRPLTSVGIWAFGNIDLPHATQWIRVLHLLSGIGFAAVGVLWIRTARLGLAGTIAAIAIMLLHPVLPSAVGSIDGFNALASSAFLWLGAWFIFTNRDRPIRAMALALLCITISIGFKEYGFALVPIAMLTIWRTWPRERRARAAITFTVALGVIVALSIFVRRFTLPQNAPGGLAYLDLNPIALARNVANNFAMLAGGLLFFGNSIWVYVNQSPAVLSIAAGAMLVAAMTIGAGLWMHVRADQNVRAWIIFCLLSFVAASFPQNVMRHVSEMYVPPILLPFVLLCGIAADGFRNARPAVRSLAATLAAVALVTSILTIRAKVAGLIAVGRRADEQLRQILSYVPADARDKTIAVRYLRSDRRPRDTYSVFRIPDTFVLAHRYVLQWPRPYQGWILDIDEVDSFDEVDPTKYDVTLAWHRPAQKFLPLAPHP